MDKYRSSSRYVTPVMRVPQNHPCHKTGDPYLSIRATIESNISSVRKSQLKMAIQSPSVQLLRVLRSFELIQHPFHQVLKPSQLCTRTLRPRTTISCPTSAFGSASRLRHYSASSRQNATRPVKSDRGPPSQEDTQTDFGSLNVLGNTPAPATSIDACLSDGFHLNNGLKIGGGSGCLLVAGEAFSWRPWEASRDPVAKEKRRILNAKTQWDVQKEAWGILELVWPKPGMRSILPQTCLVPIGNNLCGSALLAS